MNNSALARLRLRKRNKLIKTPAAMIKTIVAGVLLFSTVAAKVAHRAVGHAYNLFSDKKEGEPNMNNVKSPNVVVSDDELSPKTTKASPKIGA